MLDHETIQSFSEWIANNLQAHSDELQDEMLSNESGVVECNFKLRLARIGATSKIQAKARATFPRKALIVETLLQDFQAKLPGM